MVIAGVEFVGGDMFESVPSGGDAIFMKVCLPPSDSPISANLSQWASGSMH